MRNLSVIAVAAAIFAVSAGLSASVWGQTPPLGVQQRILGEQQLQQQQPQPQETFQQNQAQRQLQILDHATSQQQNADMATRNRADLAGQGARVQTVDPSNSARTKALVDQAAQSGAAAVPTPLQLLPH